MEDSKSNRKKINIGALSLQISTAIALANKDLWQEHDGDDSMRQTIVSAINQRGWEIDGIPGVLPFIYTLMSQGIIKAYSTFNGVQCLNVGDIDANPDNWYLNVEDANLVAHRLLGIPLKDVRLDSLHLQKTWTGLTLSWSARPSEIPPSLAACHPEEQVRYLNDFGREHSVTCLPAESLISDFRERIARQEKGLFTLMEVAQIFEESYGIQASLFLSEMRNAYSKGNLVIRDYRAPHSSIASEQVITNVLSMVMIDELDAWLKKENVGYQFPQLAAKRSMPTSGKTKSEILEFDWPCDIDLSEALSNPPKWIRPAMLVPGRRGAKNSARWCPAQLAFCLAQRNASLERLERHIRKYFPDSLEEWKSLAEPFSEGKSGT